MESKHAFGKTILLYEENGTAISSREYYVTNENMADGLVTNDGRRIAWR